MLHGFAIAGLAASLFGISSGPLAPPASAASAPLPTANMQEHVLKAVRIDTTQAPVIDGDLSDAVWAKAGVIDGITQVDPDRGQPASQRAVLRVLYDEDNLYFSVYCYDTVPGGITARTRARDGNLNSGDAIRIFLDPGLSRRNGYAFEVGPSGGRIDALIQNNTDYLTEWNTIWTERTRIVPDGWTVEIAIPFRSLSFDASKPDWGFDFTRVVRRRAERDRWTSDSPAIPNQDISQSGTLTGITGTNVGIGLDVQLYGRLAFKRDWKPVERDGLNGFFSANAYYKIAQALTGTLTLNPDFSNSPLEDRQVNTTRFSLFTPETRDFFLQDAFSFEWGGLGFSAAPFPFSNAPNARPFFSRNIGLVNGTPVTLLGGVKLSGSFDDIGIGAISVRSNDSRGARGQTLSVMRVTMPVLSQSKLGFIFTDGDPTGATRNSLAGSDFQYRSTHFNGDQILESDSYYERSFSSRLGDDDTFGTALVLPNEPWGAQFYFKQVGQNFFPALGFINRPGIRDYEATVTERTRYSNQYLRSLQFGMTNVFITGLDDELQSRQLRLWTSVQNRNVDVLEFDVYNYFENVPAAFSLPRGVPVLPGKYNWTNIAPRIDTTNGRALVLTWQVECCSFYNGDYVKSDLSVTARYSDWFDIAPHYVATWIQLPTGYVAIHLIQTVATINFTPDMQLVLQEQFDNISRNFGFSARYRWEYEPGNEVFVALGQSASIPGTTFEPQTSQFSFRLGHTFRF